VSSFFPPRAGRPDRGQPIRPHDAVTAASMQALLIRPHRVQEIVEGIRRLVTDFRTEPGRVPDLQLGASLLDALDARLPGVVDGGLDCLLIDVHRLAGPGCLGRKLSNGDRLGGGGRRRSS